MSRWSWFVILTVVMMGGLLAACQDSRPKEAQTTGTATAGDIKVSRGSSSGSLKDFPPEIANARLAGSGFGGETSLGPWGVMQPLSIQNGLAAPGFGRASMPADGAILQLGLGMATVYVPPGPIPPGNSLIPESSVNAIVEAIKGAGVDALDIAVNTGAAGKPYGPGSVTLVVRVRDLAKLDATVQAASIAASGQETPVFATGVLYTASNCGALEEQALQAAVNDARERAELLARILQVGLGPVSFATSYSSPGPFGPNGCGPEDLSQIMYGFGMPYTPGQKGEVQVMTNVNLIFSIQ
ncbi:MAG TPA: SIMPL domain-containing protein [Dehalococcoidia bacterium]|nr:SIMPL domain-containing protein [Dehalococcoidia bacterium]